MLINVNKYVQINNIKRKKIQFIAIIRKLRLKLHTVFEDE